MVKLLVMILLFPAISQYSVLCSSKRNVSRERQHSHTWAVSSDVYTLTRFSDSLTPLSLIWEVASCPIPELNMWCLTCCRTTVGCKGEEDDAIRGPDTFLHSFRSCDVSLRRSSPTCFSSFRVEALLHYFVNCVLLVRVSWRSLVKIISAIIGDEYTRVRHK